jgi:multisubunit Na+/H+ antiporter MnhF subunit
VLTLVLQAAIAFVLTASVMPFVLVTVPETRDRVVGLPVVGGLALASFLVVWVVWPRKRR